MAGGKETPRAKMIGMMYLVLTALLALQVSNSVLEKFIFIDETLHTAVAENRERNGNTLKGIEAKVKEKGDRESDLKALDKAKKVRDMTKATLDYLDDVRTEMAVITGAGDEDGYDDNGQLIGAKDYDKVGSLMMFGGRGDELKSKLNTYAADLTKLAGEEFAPLARDAKDIDIAKNDPNQNKKGFAEYYFQNTPTAAGMATISFMETEVLSYESKALDDIAAEVGAKDVSFDQIIPMVLPVSNIVAAGAPFEGDLFISASSSAVDPTMTFEGKDIEVVDGRGKIKFTASPGSYNKDGLAEKTFKATITLTDSTYVIDHPYFVAKPVIQIQSAAISSLYLNCGNELNVLVPALGTNYNPAFSATGGRAVKGAKKGEVTVIPTAAKVGLTVSSNGNRIGTENFTVKRVPKPTIAVTNRGRPINMKTGMKVPGPREISIRAIPDETFASLLPKDARYRVVEWELIIARGSRPVARKTIKKQDQSMNEFLSQIKPNDRIVIEVKKVARMNFQGKTEPVTGIANTIFSIPLH